MPDVESYLAHVPPAEFYAHEGLPVPDPEETEMPDTDDITLTQADLEGAYIGASARLNNIPVAQLVEAVKRAGGIDGATVFPTVTSECMALAAVVTEPERYLVQQVSDDQANEKVARIARRNGKDFTFDFDKLQRSMEEPDFVNVARVKMTEPTAAQSDTILRLTSPDSLDFTRPPAYATAELISREQHASRLELTPETPAEAVIRLTAEADQLAHGGAIGLARKHPQRAKQHVEHDDDDLGSAAQSLDVDAEIARYVDMAAAHHTTHGNVPGRTSPPGEPGQFRRGAWHSSSAPLRKSGAASRPGRRAPSWAPGNAAAGVGGEVDAAGGTQQ